MNYTTMPSRQLVSQDDAAMIERNAVPRSKFRGSWNRKTAFDAGWIIPFLVDEVLPGDHMTYNVTAFLRQSTLLFPMLDNQRIDTFFFYCPNRIVWPDWVKLMGEQDNPGDSIAYTVPYVVYDVAHASVGSIWDHMGLPAAGQLTGADTLAVNVLPLRAYNRIWNDWFRDENIQTRATQNTGGGPDSQDDYALKQRAKSHDYFTSALPWAQKFTAPTVPLLGTAPVTGLGVISTAVGTPANPTTVYETPSSAGPAGTGIAYNYSKAVWDPATANQVLLKQDNWGGGVYAPAVYADLTQATGVAINTLRQAWMVQQLMERDARGGTRYTELIRSHFGVVNPDFRLQRPEYIGGGSTPLSVTPIAQTAPTTGVPLGALGAAGTAVGQHSASYAATEHGFILGFINVRSELSYQQGLHRMWSKSTRYDYYWPALAGLGEQTILQKEIYCTGNATTNAIVFGYQERWHEYRTRYSEVTGVMRSTAAGTLDAWHLAQKFTSAPTLSDTFIKDTPPMSRVLAAGALANGQQYIADIQITRTAVRPIPTFGTPATLGRF